MAILIITAKPLCLPPDMDGNYHGWKTNCENGIEFFSLECSPHKLFLSECIEDVDKKQKTKHNYIAKYVKTIMASLDAMQDEELFLITHDKDLLKGNSQDEGIYREKNVEGIGGDLVGLIPDGNIYVFMHSDMYSSMYVPFIRKLFGVDKELIDRAITIIKECKNETPQS